MAKYGWKDEDEARKHVKVYVDYQDMLKDDQIEAVIIALPLFLHDKVAIEAMEHGKHVLTEKLMAHSVHQCKDMARVAHQKKLLLATGHQRHYSILYDNAVDTIKRGLIGDIHFIRAQWHRGNMPGKDSWSPELPDEGMEKRLAKVVGELESLSAGMSAEAKKYTDLLKVTKELDSARGARIDALEKSKQQIELQLLDKSVDAAKYGYEDKNITGGGEPNLSLLTARRTDSLAPLEPHRRRADGRAGQPPARRLGHLLHGHANRWRKGLATFGHGCRRALHLPARPRLRRPRLLHVRVSGSELCRRPEQEDRRHLLVDQWKRFRRVRRNRDGHQGHLDPRA